MYIFDKPTVQARRDRLKKAFDAVLSNDDVVLISSGDAIQRPGGLDQTYPFLSHPEYYWISGLRRPWGVVAYSKNDGFVDFVQQVTADEKLWEGLEGHLDGKDLSDLETWIKNKKFGKAFMFGANAEVPAGLTRADKNKSTEVLEAFNAVRRIKDQAEINMVLKCAEAANAGYLAIEKFIRAGVTEREIQIEYETAALKAGADKFPYDTIVGSGTNAAILHAIPTKKVVGKDEFVLIDGGADIDDYCVDITRVFSSSGKFTQRQQTIYDLVLNAQKKSISMCTPGTEWSDVHGASARIFAEGLRDLKVLQCSPDQALETGAISVFFPHGVGHLVGLRVRDVGGDITKPVRQHYGVRIRVDFKLQENFLITVEPGLYFVKALIENPDIREKYKNEINWTEVEKWRDLGGVRIEDDILVGATPRNLTSIVKK